MVGGVADQEAQGYKLHKRHHSVRVGVEGAHLQKAQALAVQIGAAGQHGGQGTLVDIVGYGDQNDVDHQPVDLGEHGVGAAESGQKVERLKEHKILQRLAEIRRNGPLFPVPALSLDPLIGDLTLLQPLLQAAKIDPAQLPPDEAAVRQSDAVGLLPLDLRLLKALPPADQLVQALCGNLGASADVVDMLCPRVHHTLDRIHEIGDVKRLEYLVRHAFSRLRGGGKAPAQEVACALFGPVSI